MSPRGYGPRGPPGPVRMPGSQPGVDFVQGNFMILLRKDNIIRNVKKRVMIPLHWLH